MTPMEETMVIIQREIKVTISMETLIRMKISMEAKLIINMALTLNMQPQNMYKMVNSKIDSLRWRLWLEWLESSEWAVPLEWPKPEAKRNKLIITTLIRGLIILITEHQGSIEWE